MSNNEVSANKRTDNFSVALGLFDYINPIFYTITMTTLVRNMRGVMPPVLFAVLCVGAAASLIFGFTIPTVKFIVGLGIMQFKMPVNLVFYVNSGILLSGFALFGAVFAPGLPVMLILAAVIPGLLVAVYRKSGKFNTVAVLTGAAGYVLFYTSMIFLSLRRGVTVSLCLYTAAICLFVTLCLIGIKSDLKNSRVHWAIEIGNVVCQCCVALGTVLVFR